MSLKTDADSSADAGGPEICLANFEAVIESFETPLLRYVGRLIGYDNPDSEDIVQETFIRLHKHLSESIDSAIETPKAWLYRVAHNLAMDIGRKSQRHRKHQEVIKSEEEEPVDLSTLEGMIQRETGQIALKELKMLDEEEQHIILLKTVQDLKLREISEITGLSINKVAYRLNQGLKTLALRLKEGGHFG